MMVWMTTSDPDSWSDWSVRSPDRNLQRSMRAKSRRKEPVAVHVADAVAVGNPAGGQLQVRLSRSPVAPWWMISMIPSTTKTIVCRTPSKMMMISVPGSTQMSGARPGRVSERDQNELPASLSRNAAPRAVNVPGL